MLQKGETTPDPTHDTALCLSSFAKRKKNKKEEEEEERMEEQQRVNDNNNNNDNNKGDSEGSNISEGVSIDNSSRSKWRNVLFRKKRFFRGSNDNEGEATYNNTSSYSSGDTLQQDAETIGQQLQKTLSLFDLIWFGVGAIIGAGIFVLTGVAAAQIAGPSIIVSFLFDGIACTFTAFCYCELASRTPVRRLLVVSLLASIISHLRSTPQ